MKIKAFSSGSKGNCSIVLCDDTSIIIDMGISYLTLKRSLEENSLSLDDFSGILITHCHNDHIKGLASLVKHSQLNVYIPEAMYESIKEYVPYPKCIMIEDKFNINDVEIELIHTSHDAPYSVGYIIKQDNKKITYVTDTGYINRKYIELTSNKDMYVIESNHDEEMLENGPYPYFLRQRVISDRGHLSNMQTSKYLKKVIGNKTKNIILIHLSEKNNTPELALETFKKYNDYNKNITLSYQNEPTEVIEV